MNRIVRAVSALAVVVGLSACSPQQISHALRDYWGQRQAPVDACSNDGETTVIAGVPCNGVPSVDIVCANGIVHAHQDPDYCVLSPWWMTN